MKPDKPTQDGHQGEGDRISARRYGRHVREFVAGGKVEPSAREAEAYVERVPDDAQRTERKASRGPHPARVSRVSIDELVTKGHTALDRMQSLLHRVLDRFRRRSDRR
jgi:hypothetical protein